MPPVTGNLNTTINTMMTNSVDVGTLGLIITIIIFIFAVLALLYIISSIERYTLFFRAFKLAIRSVKYALYGAGVSATAFGVYLVVSMLTTATSKGDFDPTIIAYGIGIYVMLSAIGWCAEKVITKIRERHAEYKGKGGA